METLRMKSDIQQAIANNFNNFETNYSALIFENETKYLVKNFRFYDTLNVFVKDNKLNYKIKLNDKVISQIPKEMIQKLKDIDIQIKQEDMMINMLSKVAENINLDIKDIILMDFIKSLKNIDGKNYRLPSELEVIILETIQKYIKTNLNLNLKMKQYDKYLALVGNFKKWDLKLGQSAYLLSILDFIDTFAILPWYNDNEDDEELKGVRLFFAFDLENYENEEE